MNYLIYLSNDWNAVFSCSKKESGMIDRHTSIFSWMLKRGTFYRFEDEEDFEKAASLLSALAIPAICFPVHKGYADFVRAFSFSEFSPCVVSKRFSEFISLTFDNKEILNIRDFDCIPVYYTTIFNKNRVVNVFTDFASFKSSFSEFLFTFKNIDVKDGNGDFKFIDYFQVSDSIAL